MRKDISLNGFVLLLGEVNRRIRGKPREEKLTLVGELNIIITSPLSSDEKTKQLENIYNIASTEKIKGGVAKICNLSSGILEEDIAKGELIGLIK